MSKIVLLCVEADKCTDFIEVYDNSITLLNTYQGAPFQQALSGLTNLNNDWYDGKDYATYNFYYTPGPTGRVTWSVADIEAWTLDARAIGPNGNVGQRVIPMEPMAVVMNFGMSNGFSNVDLPGIESTLPATMRFDYVRIYQDASSSSVTCDPDGYETTEYIANHLNAYTNPNLTRWYVNEHYWLISANMLLARSQTKHSWPSNTFVNGCK